MLLKLRGYLFLFLLILSMVLYWPFPVLLRFVLPARATYYVATFWGDIIMFLLKYVLGITPRISGAENIPETPCVVLSKHQSALDIFVLLRVFKPQIWVFKRELLKIPFFGWALATTNPIAIDRSAGRKALKLMIERGTEKLKNGFWILLYPEGTRTIPGKKGVYKGGGMLLAQKAGVDIVPVALNTGLFWQKGNGVVNNGAVDIVIGKPISTKDKEIKAITAEVESWIEENSLAITLNHPHYLAMKNEHLTEE